MRNKLSFTDKQRSKMLFGLVLNFFCPNTNMVIVLPRINRKIKLTKFMDCFFLLFYTYKTDENNEDG